MNTREQILTNRLTQQFQPLFLKIENESHMHSSGRGNESHFKVTIVSVEFEGLRQVARHRLIYQAVADLFDEGLHALALHTYTPTEWELNKQQIPASTNCLGHGQ